MPKPFKKFCQTRFRGIRDCIIPVLFNWEGIVKYYSALKSPTERQQLLKGYFVDREMMSLFNIHFIHASIRDVIEAIDYFERRSFLLHAARGKMEDLLRKNILKFHQETSVKKLNVDDAETVQNKKGKELLEVHLDDPKTLLTKKRVLSVKMRHP